MKKFLFILSFAFTLCVVVTSCSKKDPCEDIICQNGGTCENGDCKCPVGYEGNLCQTESLPKAVNVTAIKILKIPATQKDGKPWDSDGTQPDIYPSLFTLKADNSTDVRLWSSQLTKINADVSKQHDFNIILPALSLTDMNQTYGMFLHDSDDGNVYTSMGGIAFVLKNFVQGRPSTIKLDCSTCTIAFELTVNYEF